ncbi:hypothetical protein BDP27DRAFT_1332240 [Rhodocollybia butyracea]|uniref:Uncharacterized protein n=1 Tax=Rhodocollybia butyracea TaxID=206335 RepID=A0A9P5U458_9AGAR|nr:hypothetical protein BDP27DRAFT_1332240 [Rhodocollybia butyracea]
MTTDMSGTVLSSPTFSAMSTISSLDLVSPRSRSSTTSTQTFSLVDDSSDDDDEIVWSLSSEYHSSDDVSTESSLRSDEEDFVVLSRPRSQPSRSDVSTPNPSSQSSAVALGSELARLSLNPSVSPIRPTKQSSCNPFVEDDSPPITPVSKRRRRCRAKKDVGLGSRPIVDDVSESADDFSTDRELDEPLMYEDAVNFVTGFLQNPTAYCESSSRLTLLQALIIELGLSSPSMPVSLTSAQAVLKSQAFLNIREYLSVREKGPDAVKQVMYPSRSALIRSIRKQPRNRASLDWVKEHGLQVLLVTAYRH